MESQTPAAPGSSANQHSPEFTSPAGKRRRPSPLSSNIIRETTDSPNSPSTSGIGAALRTSNPKPQRGSSRGSDMQRSSSPSAQGGPIRYTRTGRVSKATKGQRVHSCDECGKTYTRAEHLRRHQQNHKPGAFPCDVPRCGRSFYREDLLIRHKARHNDPLDPPTRRPSIGSQTSVPAIEHAFPWGTQAEQSHQHPNVDDCDAEAVPDDLPHAAPPASTQSSTSTSLSRKDYIPITQLHPGIATELPVSIDRNSRYPEDQFGEIYDTSQPPYSSTGHNSPTNDYAYPSGTPYFAQPNRAHANPHDLRMFSDLDSPNTSRSPISAGSSTVGLPSWHPDLQSPPVQPFAISSTSDIAHCYDGNTSPNSNSLSEEPSILCLSDGSSRMMSVEQRDVMEKRELQVLTALTASSPATLLNLPMEASTLSNDRRYLDAYWKWVHPLYPIIHKPTFDIFSASPLLQAAMLQLGAHMLRNSVDMGNARIMHDRCIKVIKKRDIYDWHTYRICDMQAIFLIEVYSIFKSRRPPLQFSKSFEEIYRRLVNDSEALSHRTADFTVFNNSLASHGHHSCEALDGFSADPSVYNLHANCKERLLISCYVLDQQHAMLFGRQRTDCMGSALGISLPWSRLQMYWESPPEQEISTQIQRQTSNVRFYSQVYEAMNNVPSMKETSKDPADAFQSQLVLACLADPRNDGKTRGCVAETSTDVSPILFAVEQGPRSRLTFHTFMLCKHTPVRDLLAVAGESWVMAEKLGSPNDYAAAQIEANMWARGMPEPNLDRGSVKQSETRIERALHHALHILDIHRKHSRTGLLFQEWSIYLAAVVVWARGYITSTERLRKPRPSIPTPSEPRIDTKELDRVVASVIRDGGRMIGWNEAKHVLLWTKEKIKKVDVPHNCGLTNGALDVLGKLSTRGNEEGWFG